MHINGNIALMVLLLLGQTWEQKALIQARELTVPP